MNNFLNGLTDATNFITTENGAVAHRTTKSALLDMFAMGAAMRKRSNADCINMFKNAYEENPEYALKCLFYIRDCRGGQGERRFWRVCMSWLANAHPEAASRNIRYVSDFGRWDDLYVFVDTPLEDEMFAFLKEQLALDVQCQTPSLLAKWMASENASSSETKRLGRRTRQYLGMTARQYRKTLSVLRERINVLERLMSAGKWDEIEFDKIPSRAGMIYKNAFAKRDVERMRLDKDVQSYSDFAKSKDTKVNAKVLYPYECVRDALNCGRRSLDDTTRLMTNKYWDNLEDYFKGASFNGMAIVDTSGSMWGVPLTVSISLGLYCAEKAKGPFANHFLTFSNRPELVKVEGVDFVDKVNRMSHANWGNNTNIEAAFDLLLNTAIYNNCSQDEIPQNLLIISDMEFDHCATCGSANDIYWGGTRFRQSLFETIEQKWARHGYKLPHVIFWNVDARQNNIPMLGNGPISYVSGFSPSIFQTIMSGKSGYDLMMEKLNSERYNCIH